MKRINPAPNQLDELVRKYTVCRDFGDFCTQAPKLDTSCCNHQHDKIVEVRTLRRAFKRSTGLNLPHGPVSQRNHKLSQPQHQRRSRT